MQIKKTTKITNSVYQKCPGQKASVKNINLSAVLINNNYNVSCLYQSAEQTSIIVPNIYKILGVCLHSSNSIISCTFMSEPVFNSRCCQGLPTKCDKALTRVEAVRYQGAFIGPHRFSGIMKQHAEDHLLSGIVSPYSSHYRHQFKKVWWQDTDSINVKRSLSVHSLFSIGPILSEICRTIWQGP